MYDVIKMDQNKSIFESVDALRLDVPGITNNNMDKFYSEAVFTNGKQKLSKIEDLIKQLKAVLEEEITKQRESAKSKDAKKYKFDPKAFWRHKLFKELEDEFEKTFGFRYVEIQPYTEHYLTNKDEFESYEINAWVYNTNRFPVEGLVTDDGFYDKSKSLTFSMVMTMGLFRLLDSDELVAVIMHEMGHKIDPALTTITYSETNILSKYLTDRTGSLTAAEKKVMNTIQSKIEGGKKSFKKCLFTVFLSITSMVTGTISSFFPGLFGNTKKGTEKKVKNLLLKYDKDLFKRQTYAEAYADNFARMYGYGPQLTKSFHKMAITSEKKLNSYVKRESQRSAYILQITQALLKDEHKTDVHRIRALIKEYKDDINNPITPEPVKKQLEADVKELETVLNAYLHNFSDVQNRVNQLINENIDDLERADVKKTQKAEKKDE